MRIHPERELHGNRHTKKFEELSLAWAQTGLEHSGFSQLSRILFLEQDLIACQPSAVRRL
jgi:hypothetical protein